MDKQGVSLLGISDAAEHIGLQSLAVKTNFDRLARDIPVPCIAHWNQEHFVVVHRVTQKHVWIADPAAGRFKLTKEEFLENWVSDVEDGEQLGVLLLVETTPEFYERDGNKTSKASLNTILKKYALEGDLVEQIKYSLSNELVSTDIVGTSAPAIYDSTAAIVSPEGKKIILYVWYDNEFGYTHQVIRLAKYIAKVRRFTYY